MEVLFVSHKHPPSIGGIQAQNKALVDGMQRHARVHRLIWDRKLPLPLFLAGVSLQVAQRLRKHPDIGAIHLCDGLMGACAQPIKRFSDVPVVLTLHGLDVVIPSRTYQKWVVERFNAFDAVVAVSRETARACVDRGIDPAKLRVVSNGIDPRFSQAQPDAGFRARLSQRLGISLEGRRLIVHTGRAVRRKGLSWFLERVLPHLPKDVVFLMVGPRDRTHTTRLAHALGLLPAQRAEQLVQLFAWSMDEPAIARALSLPGVRGRAFELGQLSFDDMLQTLLHADVFVMPNLQVHGDREGFGLVALEAAACGAPVLAAALEGLEDAIVEGQNGMLLAAGDADAWVGRLHTLLADDGARLELGRRARAHCIAHDTRERMVQGYLTLFHELAQRRTQRAELM